MKRLIVAFITLAVGLGAVHLAGGEPVERQQWPDNSPLALSDAVVDRFLSREEPPLVSYRAVRVIRASNRRFHVSGELEVETEFSLDSGLRYRVARESGSELIRNRALRAVLREEQAIWQPVSRTARPCLRRTAGSDSQRGRFVTGRPMALSSFPFGRAAGTACSWTVPLP